MSRRRSPERRVILPDPKFKSELLTKFMNMVMEDGKKSVAEKILYGALDQIAAKKKTDAPILVLEAAFDNVRPKLEVKSRRVGGATYQVPVEVSPERQNSIALRWVAAAAAGRKGTTMSEALAAELVDAYNNTGNVVKKREETHKMAQANRAFAHLKW